MSKPPRTVFVCQECGAQSVKWRGGQCPDCNGNGYVAKVEPVQPVAYQQPNGPAPQTAGAPTPPMPPMPWFDSSVNAWRDPQGNVIPT